MVKKKGGAVASEEEENIENGRWNIMWIQAQSCLFLEGLILAQEFKPGFPEH